MVQREQRGEHRAKDARGAAGTKKRTGAKVSRSRSAKRKKKRVKGKRTDDRSTVEKAASDAAKAKQSRVDADELARTLAIYDSIDFEDVDDDGDDEPDADDL